MSGTSYNVTNENGLNAAILAIDAASVTAPAGTAYTIVIADDLTLNSDIAAISLASGASLSISGNDPSSGNSSAQIDGNNSYRGFVALSGAVTLDSLGLSNMQATGGRGGNGAQAGGGGAGLGGAVFVGSGADVLLSNDTISGNAAVGGGGGAKTGAGIGAGGSGEPGGFGAGGAGGVAGGFGGGGGAGAAGGFGAGSNAGGGLGAGGNIFVQQGGQLNFASGTADGGSVQGGSGGGHGYGGDIFIQGGTTVTLGNASIAGNITDQSGSGGTGLNAGAGAVLVNGSVTLSGADTYTGGTTIAGSLTLAAPGAAGSGEISFLSGTLAIGLHDTPTNLIGNFVTSDVIDLKSIGLETTASLSSGNVLTVSGGSGGAVSLNLDPTQNYANDAFILQSDGAKGTALTVTQTHFYVGSESDLNAALAEIDVGGVYVAPKTAYTITFTAGFTLNTDLNAINLAHGDTLTVNGAGNVLDGGGQYRGFFVYGGQVALQNLTIQNAVAAGGAGGAGSAPGAGGAGLGGGLYVGAGTGVSLSNVSFLNDSAVGGAAGAVAGAGNGGGGGLGGAGGASLGHSGGGGGVGTGATGGAYGVAAAGAGILIGAGAGDFGSGSGAGAGGANGGGGGIAGVFSGSGRDPRSFPGTAGAGGVSNAANFGGGAGSGQLAGFGGGGASPANADGGNSAGGLGGWGGGGSGAAGGFGGGSGAAGGAGGGLGAGGAVFVQTGGTLILQSGAEQGGAAAGGAGSGGGNGAGYGSGLFLQGGNSLNLAPGAGQSLTISDVIADSKGVTNTGGQVAVVMNGAGTATLAASNAYSGGTTLSGGTLALLAPGAAGSGAITFAYGHAASLVVGSGDTPLNVLRFFLPGDVIDLQGIGTASSAILGTGDVLAVTGGTVPVNLSLYTGQNFTGETFAVASDKQGGTLLTAVTVGNDQPPSISGSAVGGTDHAAFAPLKGVAITDLNAGQTESVTLQLSSTKNGGLGNLSGGSYNVATGVYTVSGSAAAVTSALQGLVFTPTEYQAAPGAVVYTNFNLSVTDGTMIAAAPLLVGVKALNDAPVVSGGVSQQDAYWNVPVNAFAGVTIADPDAKASESVTLTVGSYSGGPNGTLSLASPVDGISMTNTATGTYTLTAGSPGAVTAALDAVMFTPTTTDPNLGFTITNLGVSVADGIAAPVTGANITVYAGLPIITGTQAGQMVADTAKIAPFSTVQISDSAYFTQESVTILLTNAAGNATDANGTLAGAGLSKAGTGIYTLASGSPIAVSSALDALVFSPSAVAAGQTVTTNFTLEVFDGATTSDNGNTSVIASGPGAMAFLRPASMTAPAFGFTSAVHGALTAADFAPRGADGCMFQPVVSAWEGNSAGMAQADNGLFAASGHAQIIATTPLDHARGAAHAA